MKMKNLKKSAHVLKWNIWVTMANKFIMLPVMENDGKLSKADSNKLRKGKVKKQ